MSGTASVPTQFQAAVTATGLQLDNNFSTIVAYLNDPTNRMNYAADGGSTNTLVINPSPAVTGGYSAGLTITFRAAFSNSGAVVANVNGLGNASVLDQQQRQLTSSAIIAGSVYQMAYNGTSAFNLLSPNAVQASGPTATLFTVGTYTFTAASGVVWARVDIQAGGGSGGIAAASSNNTAISSGGGAGGYGWLITNSFPGTITFTVGAGGINGPGGNTSFGGIATAFGGSIGPGETNATAISGGAGGSCTGAVITGSIGANGCPPQSNGANVISGAGANSLFGAGGQGITATTGPSNPGSGYGSGGSGTKLGAAGSGSSNGGAGGGGFVVITQYFSA